MRTSRTADGNKRGAPALAAALVVALVAGSSACAHRGASATPEAVVQAFAAAAARGDWDRAYALMSVGYRRRVPLAKFRAERQAEAAVVAAGAAAWARPALSTSAEVRSSVGDHVALVLDGDEWRLAVDPLAPFDQQSPRGALRAFVRAVELRRYDVLLRLVPAGHRGAVTEATLRTYWEGGDQAAHRRLLDRLRSSLEAPIVELGSEANLLLAPPDDGEVHFVLEEGSWRIDDIE